MPSCSLWISGLFILGLALQCNNNPYGEYAPGKSYYTNLTENPASLDPARIYGQSGYLVASNIYDTPYQFHYLKRPLTIIPSMAATLPERGRTFFKGQLYHSLRIPLRQDLEYAPDECFEQKERRIKAKDFIFSIKRAADDSISPFGGAFLSDRVLGFDEFRKTLASARAKDQQQPDAGHPLHYTRQAYQQSIPGVRLIPDNTLEILMKEPYPQVLYFFTLLPSAPIPEHCVWYYATHSEKRLDQHTIASGPFMLKQWRDGHSIGLIRNPAYRKDDYFPEIQDEFFKDDPSTLRDTLQLDTLQPAMQSLVGKTLPMLDSVHFQIIPRDTARQLLFEQGYLDSYHNRHDLQSSLLSSPDLKQKFIAHNIKSYTDPEPVTFGWSLNLKDPVLGSNLKLRQALALLLNRDEFLRRFFPGRGIEAHGLLPPMIAGAISRTDKQVQTAEDRLKQISRLLNQAGYPEGRDPKTGQALKLHLRDRASQGRQAIYQYYIDSFRKVGLVLEVEALDFPTLIEKKNTKDFQIIHFGWGADYPDAQNFFQLFYGPLAKTPYNESSYQNAEFDQLYEQMVAMPASPARTTIIQRMQALLNRDVPVVLLFHRSSTVHNHDWVSPIRINPLQLNTLKYIDLDPEKRSESISTWNRTPLWSYAFMLALLVGLVIIFWRSLTEKHQPGTSSKQESK